MRLSLGDAGRSQALLRILAAHRLNGALMKPPPLKYWVLAAGVAVFHFIATFNLFGYIMACGGSFTPCTTPMWVGVSYLVLTFPVFYVMPTQWAIGVGRRCGDPVLGVQATTGTVRRVRKEL